MRAQTSPWVARMRGHRVVVVGDPVLDVYLNGSSERVSREAPVLIVREESRDHRLGGAANAAANLAALGAEVVLVGLVGEDAEARTLANLAAASRIDGRWVACRERPTTTKTRVMAGALHLRKQQMLRIDREDSRALEAGARDRLRSEARAALLHADALVVSDYGAPSLTDVYVELAAGARDGGRTVVVDSRRALARFEGATAVTPNQPEVEAVVGRRLKRAEEVLAEAQRLTERLGLQAALVTRGREGMVVASATTAAVIPAVGGDAVDVTGAGDTVTAAFTLALLAGAPVLAAAHLANLAASVTVQQVGTAVCTPAELLAATELP